jgi:(E)-4-hydroxy-3-methylbut-2-enyl-diphosphate synthase
VSVQTMTVTPTHEVDTTLQAIAAVQAAGADIVRVAVPRMEDADALAAIAEHARIPVIADIHFQWKYAVKAIEAGCAGVRINPGNIKKHDKVKLIGDLANDAGVAIRIGVNGGSLEDVILDKHGGPTPEAMVESALNEVRLLEDVGFHDTKISVKHSDPWVMIETYRLLADRTDYPLHLGVTEAGPKFSGSVKSAIGIGTLLAEGIGDTIRVSLSADPIEEVKVGIQILEALHLRERGLDVVSCPSCGRAQVDVWKLAEDVQKGLDGKIDVPLRVAVMGCVVNGPGEAREADIGVAAGNGKGQIIQKGETIATVREEDIVETLVHFATEMADQIRAERGSGQPSVSA